MQVVERDLDGRDDAGRDNAGRDNDDSAEEGRDP